MSPRFLRAQRRNRTSLRQPPGRTRATSPSFVSVANRAPAPLTRLTYVLRDWGRPEGEPADRDREAIADVGGGLCDSFVLDLADEHERVRGEGSQRVLGGDDR